MQDRLFSTNIQIRDFSVAYFGKRGKAVYNIDMIKSTFDLENKLFNGGYKLIIGIDEVGRGPLAGPVVAAAATVRNDKFLISNFQTSSNDQNPNDKMFDLVRDSKTLSEKQREKIFDFIMKNFYVGVGMCNHKTVDRMNILEASFLAMKAALADLRRIRNQELGIRVKNKSRTMIHDSKFIILIDGNKKIPNLSMEQKAIVRGDKYIKSISAASIIAKVTRDRMMHNYHKKYPDYGFDKHKGYGTKLHKGMIASYGPCKIHRRSFNLS